MRTLADYRERAEECRTLAKLMVAPEDRKALEDLAQTWETIANMRERGIERGD